MPKLNRTTHAILGFLTWCPMSGYDIKKAIEDSTSNFWSESYGQIYPILKRLTQEGLVTQSSVSTQGGRDRHVYTITEAGQHELQRWLDEPTGPCVVRNELLLKLFFGRQTGLPTNIRHLEKFLDLQHALLEKYEGIENRLQDTLANHPDLPYWLMTVRYGKYEKRALIQWSKETLAELRKLGKTKHSQSGSA